MTTSIMKKLTNTLKVRRGEGGEGWLGGPLRSPEGKGGDTRSSLTP